MSRINNFDEYSLNESKKMEALVSKVQDLMETDLLTQDFMKAIMAGETDYTLDSQDEPSNGRDEGGTSVWVEIKAKPGTDKEIEKDYKKFAAPFEAWAKKHDLYDPEILGDDDGMLFQITILK